MKDIEIGGFKYNFNEKGDWIYKASEQDLITPFKKNGVLKKQYKDLPRFKVIVNYEKSEVDFFSNLIADAVKDISLKLLSFSY